METWRQYHMRYVESFKDTTIYNLHMHVTILALSQRTFISYHTVLSPMLRQ